MRVGLLSVTLFVVSLVVVASDLAGPTDIVSEADVQLYERIVQESREADGRFASLRDVFFAVSLVKALGGEIPQGDVLCKQAQSVVNEEGETADIASLHFAIGIRTSLACPEKWRSDIVVERLKEAALGSSIPDAHHAMCALDLLDRLSSFDDTELVDQLDAILKLSEDDGTFRASPDAAVGDVSTTGLAYELVAMIFEQAELEEGEALQNIVALSETAKDVLAMGEVEDEDYVEFHDAQGRHSLSTTYALFRGLSTFTKVTGLEVDVTQDFVVRVAEFFVQHKTAFTIENAYYVYQGAVLCSENPFGVPLVLRSLHSVLGADATDTIRISVTNLLGQFAVPVTVSLHRAFPVARPESPALQNVDLVPLSPGRQNIDYTFDLLATQPEPGFYTLELSAMPLDGEGTFIAVESAERPLKVTTSITLQDFSMRVGRGSPVSPTFPAAASTVLEAERTDRILFSFRVTSSATGVPVLPQQTFLRFVHSSGRDVFFVARPGADKVFQLAIDLAKTYEEEFEYLSGEYKVIVIVGDAFVQNSLTWNVGSIRITLPDAPPTEIPEHRPEAQEELVHTFAVPQIRAPTLISRVFTGLTLAPVLFLLIGLLRVGANIGNLPSGFTSLIATLGFHVCIALLLLLLATFWIRLTIVETLRYLAYLAVPTVFLGLKALRDTARKVKVE